MKKNIFKKTGYAVLAILVIIQFIHPAGNDGDSSSAKDITHIVFVPGDVKTILQTSCFDCHSNHTNYPWYHLIQPLGFWLDDHVKEGKKELNFSEFGTYKPMRQVKKLKKISKEIKEQEMPLGSYTFIHRYAVLTDAQALRIMSWADSAGLTIHVPDSLTGKK